MAPLPGFDAVTEGKRVGGLTRLEDLVSSIDVGQQHCRSDAQHKRQKQQAYERSAACTGAGRVLRLWTRFQDVCLVHERGRSRTQEHVDVKSVRRLNIT